MQYQVISDASCTTNCLVQALGVLKAHYGLSSGHMGSMGGVAALDWKEGVVSPGGGGVGYDIKGFTYGSLHFF